MKAFWMVWNPQGRTPAFQHETEKQAREEAERLARANQGHRFYVLQAMASVSKIDVQWSEPDRDFELPF